MPSDLKITTELLFQGTLVFALVDAVDRLLISGMVIGRVWQRNRQAQDPQ